MITAELTASDLAAVVVTVLVVFGAILALVVAQSVLRTIRAIRTVLDDFVSEATPLLEELRETVGQTGQELERANALLDTAESISTSVDNASRVAYLALSNPVIKSMAFASGAGRAARKLRKVED